MVVARDLTSGGAVFLDRDGTIAPDVPYCSREEDFELYPGAGSAIKLLKNSGYRVIVN
jgi:D-sedoheptulose 7-phosphate isomerase